MTKIAITRITVVDAEGSKTPHNGLVIIEKTELEEYRKSIKKDSGSVDHVLFIYEEVADD